MVLLFWRISHVWQNSVVPWNWACLKLNLNELLLYTCYLWMYSNMPFTTREKIIVCKFFTCAMHIAHMCICMHKNTRSDMCSIMHALPPFPWWNVRFSEKRVSYTRTRSRKFILSRTNQPILIEDLVISWLKISWLKISWSHDWRSRDLVIRSPLAALDLLSIDCCLSYPQLDCLPHDFPVTVTVTITITDTVMVTVTQAATEDLFEPQ